MSNAAGPSSAGAREGSAQSPPPLSDLLTAPTSLPTSKHNLTPQQRQAAALSKLLANPEKQAPIPAPPNEKTLRPPREMMKNVSGSSAGAGSGEFHVYKHARRREYERIKLMEDKAKREEEAASFAERQAALDAASEAKTSKNRAKREKKKAAQAAARVKRKASGDGTAGKGADADDDADDDQGTAKKRIVADVEGAQKIVFKRPGQRDEE